MVEILYILHGKETIHISRYAQSRGGGHGWKIVFNANHQMPSNMHGHGAEMGRKQNPFCMKWVK